MDGLFDFQTIQLDNTGPIIMINDGVDAETFADIKRFETEYGEYIERGQIEGIVDGEHAEGELHPAFVEFAIANGLGDPEDFYGEDDGEDEDFDDEDDEGADEDVELPPVIITRVLRLQLGAKSKLLVFVADPYFDMEEDNEGFDDEDEEDLE